LTTGRFGKYTSWNIIRMRKYLVVLFLVGKRVWEWSQVVGYLWTVGAQTSEDMILVPNSRREGGISNNWSSWFKIYHS